MPSLIVNCRNSVEQVQVLQDIAAQPMRLRGVHVSWGAARSLNTEAPQPGIDTANITTGNQQMFFMAANSSENDESGFTDPYLLKMTLPVGSYTPTQLADAFNAGAAQGVEVVPEYGVWTDGMKPFTPLNLRVEWNSANYWYEFYQVPSLADVEPAGVETQTNAQLGLVAPASYLSVTHTGSAITGSTESLYIDLVQDGGQGDWTAFAQEGDYILMGPTATYGGPYQIIGIQPPDSSTNVSSRAFISWQSGMSAWSLGTTSYTGDWNINRNVDAVSVPRTVDMPTFVLGPSYTPGLTGIPMNYTLPPGNSEISVPAASSAILANYVFGLNEVAPNNYFRVPGNAATKPDPPYNMLRGDPVPWFEVRKQIADEQQQGALVDLSQIGASSREITGYSANIGAHSYLYLPRSPFLASDTSGQSNPTTYYMPMNLSFNSNDIRRTFTVETKLDSIRGGECPFGENQLNEFTLYFDYGSNANPYG